MSNTPKRAISVSDRNIGVLQKNKDMATIYIGNLSYSVKEKQLKGMFAKFGEVTYVRLMMDIKTQKSKGFAFIQMTNKQEANNAITFYNAKEFNGRTLKASFAKESDQPKEFKPQPSIKEKEEIFKEVEKKKPVKRKRTTGLDELFAYKNSQRT